MFFIKKAPCTALNKWMVWYLLTVCPHFYSPFAFMKNFAISFLLVIIACIADYGQTGIASTLTQTRFLADSTTLPVHNFSVTEKDSKALLRWKADTLAVAESFYAVERSGNGIDFSMVGITKSTSNGWIEFLDDSPPKGKIFYRIKLSAGQKSFYSEIIAASPAADVSCKFYPNPVDNMLIVKSELSIELQISDRFGKTLITDKFPGGLKVIDVSALEPGIYIVTLFQKETSHQVTEKLVKK